MLSALSEVLLSGVFAHLSGQRAWHPMMQQVKTRLAVRVWRDASGEVKCELLSNDQLARLRSYSPGNRTPFPAVTVTVVSKEFVAAARNSGDVPYNWLPDEKSVKKFATSVKTSEKLIKALGDSPVTGPLIDTQKLISSLDSQETLELVANVVVASLGTDKDAWKLYNQSGLYVTVYFEAGSRHWIDDDYVFDVNTALGSVVSLSQAESDDQDCLGGVAIGSNENFTPFTSPIGRISIWSVNADSEHYLRWGRIGKDACMVGKDSRSQLDLVLQEFCDAENRHRFWDVKLIGGHKIWLWCRPGQQDGNEQPEDLLLAMLGDEQRDYGVVAASVLKSLKTLSPVSEAGFCVDLFEKVGKTGTSVERINRYASSYAKMADRLQTWLDGCSNVPEITARCWGRAKGEQMIRRPAVINPVRISELLTAVGLMDGRMVAVNKPVRQLLSGFDFLMATSSAVSINLMAKTLAAEHLKYLFAFSNARRLVLPEGKITGFQIAAAGKNKTEHDDKFFDTVTLCGLVLKFSNRNKEQYVESIPYLIGVYLKLADRLQICYLNAQVDQSSVGSNIPPQLCGSEFVSRVMTSSGRCIGDVLPRIRPYLDWARSKNASSVWGHKARESASLASDVAAKLAANGVGRAATWTDLDKIEFTLGYLATI